MQKIEIRKEANETRAIIAGRRLAFADGKTPALVEIFQNGLGESETFIKVAHQRRLPLPRHSF